MTVRGICKASYRFCVFPGTRQTIILRTDSNSVYYISWSCAAITCNSKNIVLKMPEVTAGCTGVLISQFSKIFLPKLPTFTLSTLILNELRISLSHRVGLHLWYERYMHPQQGVGFSEHQSQSGALQPCRKTFLYSFKAQYIL